jgi:hypothetical protein
LDRNIKHLQVYGNSYIAINWMKGVNCLHNVQLRPVGELINEICTSFDFISFTHVYGELNQEADYLSKKGKHLAEGVLEMVEF